MNIMKEKYKSFLEKHGKWRNMLDIMFLIFLYLDVLVKVLQTTAFKMYSAPEISMAAQRILLWIVIARLLFLMDQKKELIMAVSLGAVVFVLNIYKPDSILKLILIAGFGSICMDYRKILKWQVIVVGMMVLIAVMAVFSGSITNLVYITNEGMLRDSFGICYPTDFASYLFYLLVFFWIAWDKIPHWVFMIIVVPFFYVAGGYALSDTCVLCGVAFLASLIFLVLREKFEKKYNWMNLLAKVKDLLLVLVFPLFAFLMFGMIGIYARETVSGNPGLAYKLNHILTGRLQLTYNVIQNVGITAFGNSLAQQGKGFTTFPVVNYDFVDSSYPLILLQNGWIVFLVITILWVCSTYRAVRAKRYRLAFGMALIAFHSLSEHHFIESNYNILLFLPFLSYKNKKTPELKEGEKDNDQPAGYAGWLGTCTTIMIALFGITSAFWLARIRNICGYLRRFENGSDKIFIVAIVLLIIPAIVLLCRGGAGILSAKREGKNRKKYNISTLCGALLFILTAGIGLWLNNAAIKSNAEIVSQDAAMLHEMEVKAIGSLYSTEYPVNYRKLCKKLRYSILTGEDLARKSNATVIVPRMEEDYVFFRNDFERIVISNNTAVYTNDPGVLEWAQSSGFEHKAFFDETRYVELPTNMAPAVNLRSGTYEIGYCFHVTEGEAKPNNIAEITIVGNKGYEILMQQEITADEMDENGNVVLMIPLELRQDTSGMMFYILGSDGCKIDVKEVSYKAVS